MEAKSVALVIEAVAEKWRDPEYGPRERATAATLREKNRFTREAITFAVNQQIHQISADGLLDWAGGRPVADAAEVAVINPGNVPFAELQDFLAVTMVGHRYRGKLSARSPYLLSAFAEELQEEGAGLDATLSAERPDLQRATGLIASGSDLTMSKVSRDAAEAGMAAHRQLLRGNRFSVAILSGAESEDAIEGLAEDILLHEGLGCRNVAVVWAPRGFSPDPLLDAMAQFRAVFPSHPSTAGALTMQIAFHRAADLPHAYAEDGSFMMSKGDPEVQTPGHVRWTEYSEPAEVESWLTDHLKQIQVVVAEPRMQDLLLLKGVEVVRAGYAQRPTLFDPGLIRFLRSL